jgi:PTH1 family peptidyl-tRNA hydrolase
MEELRLVIGLGNPGAEYENTYHNAGAMAVEAIAASFAGDGVARWEAHKKLFTYLRVGRWIFMRPLSFMNESGTAVREAVRKFNVSPHDIVVLHDDSDLALGAWKISRGRGAAGHHGVESTIAALGTNGFTRIRIGIRPQRELRRSKAETFVLKPVTKRAAVELGGVFRAIAEYLSGTSGAAAC